MIFINMLVIIKPKVTKRKIRFCNAFKILHFDTNAIIMDWFFLLMSLSCHILKVVGIKLKYNNTNIDIDGYNIVLKTL